MIWLKVIGALVAALLSVSALFVVILVLPHAISTARGWLARARKTPPPPPVLVPSDGSHDALDEDPERDATFEELVADLEVDR